MATDLGKAYITIVPSSRGLGSSIANEVGNAAGPASAAFGKGFVGKLKGVLGAAALGKVMLDAFKQGAALEQSIGGIETLYGKSADIIKKYAKDAWQSAGIDANTYMEQSTSFAAALVKSLGGNQAKAAEAANTAITDMADNSNKMGTALESIQMAYQGFAKGQYQLLDNLKLGYGGTKGEMERLLADASKLSGQTYDISNLADVYDAIHVIQVELGITGTTSKEAATTLTGSFMSMKAAAKDFMGNLVLGEGLGPSMANLATSASTFLFNNLVPAIGRVLKGLPTVLVSVLQDVVPNILNKITELLNKFAEGPELSKNGQKFFETFGKGIAKALPSIVKAVAKLISALLRSILTLPAKLMDAGWNAMKGFVKGLLKVKIPKLHITWSEEKRGSGGKLISIPKPTLKWYKTGGIFDGPSVVGVGEAGKEAVVPLSGNQMRPFAEAIAQNIGNTGNTYYIGDVTIDASSLEDIATIDAFANMLKRAKAFA